MRVPSLALIGLLLAFDVAEAQRVETGFLDRVATVDGHEFRYQVYLPNSYTAETRWPVILFLHGAGERGSARLLDALLDLEVREAGNRVVLGRAPRAAGVQHDRPAREV